MTKLVVVLAALVFGACGGTESDSHPQNAEDAEIRTNELKSASGRRVAVTPRLSVDSERLWAKAHATSHEIDQAFALDVCRCPDIDCVRGLQASYYERRAKAVPQEPRPEQAAAVRKMRVDCTVRLSREAYNRRVVEANQP